MSVRVSAYVRAGSQQAVQTAERTTCDSASARIASPMYAPGPAQSQDHDVITSRPREVACVDILARRTHQARRSRARHRAQTSQTSCDSPFQRPCQPTRTGLAPASEAAQQRSMQSTLEHMARRHTPPHTHANKYNS
jgi:hypothetical protein